MMEQKFAYFDLLQNTAKKFTIYKFHIGTDFLGLRFKVSIQWANY